MDQKQRARQFAEVIGGVPSGEKKYTNGMDDIDEWANRIGQSERKFNELRITRKNRKNAVGVSR